MRRGKTMTNFQKQKICFKFFSKFVWENNKSYYLWQLIYFVARTFGAFIDIIGMKYLVDEVSIEGRRDLSHVVFWIAFICIGNFLYDNLIKVSTENQGRINENLTRQLHTKLSMCCLDMKFEHTESPKMLDYIKNAQKALNETDSINGLINPIVNIISNTCIALGVVTIVCTKVPFLLIPVTICFVVNMFVNKKVNELRGNFFKNISKVERVTDYYNTELQDQRYAKDIRLYNAGDIFLDKLVDNTKGYYSMLRKIDLKVNALFSGFSGLQNVSNIVVYILLGVNVIKKAITIGDFSSLFNATGKFNNSLFGIINAFSQLSYTASVLIYYVEFVENTFDKEDMFVESTDGKEFEMPKEVEIEFRNVSFKYPRTEKYILKNVSTKIKAGEHLSIVGQNGAGKTTFIKLLCKMYEDFEGEILVGGKDIREYSFKEYMKLLSVVFQDFRLFAFTLKENITIFDENEKDMNEIYDISGIADWVNSLPDKDDTYIYKFFVESGVEPSGGQGQKMAIARAIYRNSPIVVLDEPTAALDPLSEYEVYNNFDKLVNNKTAVYISHRLSSCRFCDRIIVFDDGRIIEEGTHDSLMSIKDGFYALMYNTQAKQYN